MNIDIHSHYIPEQFIQMVKDGTPSLRVKIIDKCGTAFMQHDQGYIYPLFRGFYDLEYRLTEMKRSRIDMAALSAAPPLFYYDADEATACNVARLVNDGISNAVRTYPDKFVGVGSVPLQHVSKAVLELEYIADELGFRAIQIGSNIEGKQLDTPELEPFFAKAEELGILIMAHPYYVGSKGSLEKYYLTNLVGNPLDTVLAITHLIFGGVLDKFPGLKFCFAHGGGYFPYQIGRLEQGHAVRNEPKVNGAKSIKSYLKQLYFDTILFDGEALRYLTRFAGNDHVMMGTDYPFDMGESLPVDFVEQSIENSEERKAILEGNASFILSLT